MGLSRTKMLAGIQAIMIDVFNDVINKPKYEQKTNSLYQNKVKQIADLANKTLKTTLSLKIVIKGFFIEFEVSITKIIDELTNKLFTDVDPPKRSRHPILYHLAEKLIKESVKDRYKKFQQAVTKIMDSLALKSVSVGYSNDKLSIFSHFFGMTIKYSVGIKDTTPTPLEVDVKTIKDDVTKIKEKLEI